MSQSLISFDLMQVKEPIFIYNNKLEWDNSPYSFASFKHEWDIEHHFSGIRRTQGKLAIAYKEPEKFPCLVIEGPRIDRADQPDEIMYFFIYDFETSYNPAYKLVYPVKTVDKELSTLDS